MTGRINNEFTEEPGRVRRLPYRSVLAVDDNYASRLMIKSLMEREQCDVTLAENGKDAVSFAARARYDVILMDIQMPIMDGVTATRLIRTRAGSNSKTPIIAVTAFGLKEFNFDFDGVDTGFNGFLTKPFSLEKLQAVWQGLGVSPHSLSVATTLPIATPQHIDLLDLAVLDPLCQAAPPAVMERLLSRFWTSTDEFLGVLHTTLAGAILSQPAELTAFRSAAHALKGSAANIGLSRLSQAAAELQNAPPQDLQAQMMALETGLDKSRRALNSYIDDANPRPAAIRFAGKG